MVAPFRPDPTLRTVDVLPPRETGWWGPETVVCQGIRYSRLHGGTWIERDLWCDWSWGDFGCAKRAHGPEEPHHQTFWHDLSETRIALVKEAAAQVAAALCPTCGSAARPAVGGQFQCPDTWHHMVAKQEKASMEVPRG